MLRSLARFSDADLPAPEALIASMRAFFATWADQLRHLIGTESLDTVVLQTLGEKGGRFVGAHKPFFFGGRLAAP